MFKDIKRASLKNKNNKVWYYLVNYLRQYIPSRASLKQFEKEYAQLGSATKAYIQNRVSYYNRMDEKVVLPSNAVALSDFKLKDYPLKVYYFDTYQYTRFFPSNLRICPLFGDISYVPDVPSLTKARPIGGDNANSVLLKLNKIRHFLFVKDKNRFEDKKNLLVGRSKARQPHRVRFLDMYFNHPLCDIGQVNRDMNLHYLANRLTIGEHLKYKFILCLEGNEVASNLKWVMSSNSIAVMPKPKCESWFMEGTLIPDHHYILIKDDYSDLEERLNYYIEHTDKAIQILENAHMHVAQFRNKKREDLISILVLEKYFRQMILPNS